MPHKGGGIWRLSVSDLCPEGGGGGVGLLFSFRQRTWGPVSLWPLVGAAQPSPTQARFHCNGFPYKVRY